MEINFDYLEETRSEKEILESQEHCKGCYYFADHCGLYNHCAYAALTKKLRGCKAGEGCIRKEAISDNDD